MNCLQKKHLYLLAALPSVLAGKEAPVTKTFKFKEDFYIKFHPLDTAIGPDNVDMLMTALDDFADQFKAVWIEQIEGNLQGGGVCTVNSMRSPTFTMCNWKYPDLYDVDELPTPGQCYDYENGFIQRIYYSIKDLEITCPEDFEYDDLKKDDYVDAAFSTNDFLTIIKPTNSDNCDEADPSCLFATANIAESSNSDECTAELYINRFVDVPIVLKCLDYAYGPKTANKLIKALDQFFEEKVERVLSDTIYDDDFKGHIYSFVSPYASDRKYCGHGSYYAGGGNLVDQEMGNDGIILTKFTYGFDVIWYRPEDFEGELLGDENVSKLITSVFEDGEFLRFLEEEYPQYDFIQGDVCDVVDPEELPVTFAPITSKPTRSPSYSPVIITSEPTLSPTTDIPTSSPSLRPTASHVPTAFIEPSVSPSQTSNPSYAPTPFPTLLPTTGSTAEANTEKTLIPTPMPSPFPTSQPTCPNPANCIIHPDDLEEDECPIVTTGTCGDGVRGDGVCAYDGYCCSKWGFCGTSPEHCDGEQAPSPTVDPAPTVSTYSIDAGQCGKGSGDVGDGFCSSADHCCSDWGYCGSGEQYCYTTTRSNDGDDESGLEGTCGGGGPGDGQCKDVSHCCSIHGFCGSGPGYCTGYITPDEPVDEDIVKSSPLPEGLKPEFGFRCGITEVDARSNCKKECTHLIQCDAGEECWGVQLNYCHTFERLQHPVCTDLDTAENDSRCGVDEASARGHCGPKCGSDSECGDGEYCFPTLLNLCECHAETCPEESEITFAKAKALISPYFVETNPLDSVEGVPRNASFKSTLSATVCLVLMSAMLM